MILFAQIVLVLAAFPTALYFVNLLFYRPPRSIGTPLPAVSVLIPARNESLSIRAAVESALASEGIELEVIVLDDHSEDDTASIVRSITDDRVRLESAPPLPDGWCGKQHAWYQLSKLAKYDVLCFVDADVRLSRDGLAKMVTFLLRSKAELVSGIPRQETGTFLERLVIPLIHFVLLGYLPMIGMRLSKWASFGAGCGQWFVTHRTSYEAIGGHSAVKTSLHDGITLPRAYRRAKLKTDMADVTELATCRMYRTGREVWYGLAKNAREGMAAPALILPFTFMLFGGQVFPIIGVLISDGISQQLFLIALALTYLLRFDAAWRFQQSCWGAILHPLGVLVLLMIQWYATFRHWIGRPIGWKGRSHPDMMDTPSPNV